MKYLLVLSDHSQIFFRGMPGLSLECCRTVVAFNGVTLIPSVSHTNDTGPHLRFAVSSYVAMKLPHIYSYMINNHLSVILQYFFADLSSASPETTLTMDHHGRCIGAG